MNQQPSPEERSSEDAQLALWRALQCDAGKISISECKGLLESFRGRGADLGRPRKLNAWLVVTPMAYAVRRGMENWIRSLHEMGEPLSQLNHEGHSLLHRAVNHFVSLRTLEDLGMDLASFRNQNGQTLLHMTLERSPPGSLQAKISYLLAAGVDVNHQDRFGLTAAHLAGQSPTLDLLRRAGADFNLGDCDADTVAHNVARNLDKDSDDLLRYLISQDDHIDWNARNTNGETPIDLLSNNENVSELARGFVAAHLSRTAMRRALGTRKNVVPV